MIGASEKLYNYFNQNIREEGQEIEIKITKGEKRYTITDDDLVASSVKITKKSVSGASFDIGECYVDSATFTINKNINNYKSLTGAKVTIRIKVNNTDLNLSESVLLGTFRILQDGIKRTNTLLQVTADSYISKFDKSRKRATFTGDLYDLVKDSCSKCKVTFGMTENEFRALSQNVAKTYDIKKDSSLKTHRDVIMYVSQLIGGFATTTPSGALIFKNYTSNNDVCNVNDNVIVNYSIGDEVYNLSGLGMSVKENDVYLYREGEDDDSPYFLNLDTNPIMDNCTDAEITSIVENIWSKLIDLNLNNFSFEFNGNPFIEVGDIISIPERSLETYVASCEWTYHGKETISCVSVDKNKRTETQREKQNENKPSNDSRVDDLIKNTTTKTRKVRKILHTTLNLDDNSSVYLGNFNDNITGRLDGEFFEKIENIDVYDDYLVFSPSIIGRNATIDTIDSAFYKDTKGIKAEDIIKITIDISELKRYVVSGLVARNRDLAKINDDEGNIILQHKKYFNIPTIPNSATAVNSQVIKQQWNNIDLLKNSIYELDYNGDIGTEYPDISNLYGYSTIITRYNNNNNNRTELKRELISLQYKTDALLEDTSSNTDKYLDITNGNTIEITSKYINDLYSYNYFNDNIELLFELPEILNMYSLNLVNKSMQALETTTEVIDDDIHGYESTSSTRDISKQNDAYAYIYGSNFTEDASFNTIIAEKVKELNKIKSLPVTVEYIKEERYTTTIEGTSDKINENEEKTDKNKDEIEQLKTKVKKNTASINKLKQQVKSVTNKVGTMSNSLGSAKTDIAKLDIRITKLENSGGSSGGGMTDAQKKQLEQNTKDISTLKTTVSNNTRNISTNTTNITNLTTRVTNLENSGGSGGSGSGITEEERQQIQTNKTDIANNTKNISTNTTNITNLTTRVTNLENSGGSGGSGITEEERQQIQTNKTDIANLTTRITNLENSGGSGGSGSGITEAERQQIQTNKQNIENLTLTVNGQTTSIEDILRRLTQLEQGGGGETGDAFKFIKLELIFKDSDNKNSYVKNDYDFNKYFINGAYYFSNDDFTYYRLKATLNKTGTKQTFRETFRTDGTQYYMIGKADIADLESATVRFSSTSTAYLDCISKLDDQQIISSQIKVIMYNKMSATSNNRNWRNETTGNTVYTDGGAHIGDIISVPLTVKNGFKALSINNKPQELNKYWYAITTSNSNKKGAITNWTELNAEPNIATNITFTYDESLANKEVYVHITDGQFTASASYLYIKKLT